MSLEKALKEITVAKKNLLESYFEELRNYFNNATEEQRDFTLRSVEELYQELQENQIIDPNKLKEMRKGRNISLTNLAKELGISRGYICRLENGASPFTKKEGSCRKYLEWLKKQGYNPYGL
ncbi:MAG TPA: helix-turn-helix transcriptional regulator [Nanoarchaeota archaeon]|nr:helix-turn-helix transcriptional regulator [Candidatus Woesearchaeota archaeon]HIH15740.1 helix-turn-helix transcriptional regulator [Nanoarchaeota archaeon]HIH58448.1 helix-turn-helix transcriptional regulator [Nanoarchaeota archaeon]HII13702.1 helix-turn-helix transcriptional regulator [Nanoarchaeota archaeon]HIJ05653.1 helix-turn-helix transcriptional regulator [Nanoarchaeota archaeon]